MPLAEFYLKAIEAMPGNTPSKMGNSSPEQILMPDSDFAELLWENGQVVMHGHPSRPRKSLTTTTGRDQERDNGNENDCYPKNAQISAFELPGNDFFTARNDDMVPWINYSINESFPNEPLQSNLFSEFMEELSGANLDSSLCTCADGSDSFGQEVRDLDNVEHENDSKALTETSEHGRSKTSQFLQLSQPCQSPDLNSNTRIPDSGTGVSTKTQAGACTESPKTRLLNQNLATSTPSRPIKNLENFSLFSRPLTASTANLQIADRLRSNEKTSAPVDSNCMESTMIKSSSRINCMESTMTKSSSRIKGGVTDIQGHSASVLTKSELEAFKSPLHGQSESICEGDAPGKDNNNQNNGCSSTAFKKHETGKVHEVVVTTSSMCSVSSAGSDLKHRRKRKISEGEESSTYLSEDLEDELACKKKYAAARRTGTKRSRATEVHNLSERRRRDKINEKMRALQELIPNCNKADKASMLEEAIEYLKTLQLQVQIMSMGSGMYMPPVMLPPGMPHMRAPCMSHFSPMRVGMGVRYGMGMYDMNASCPVMPVPSMHGLQFPCPPVPGPPMHGILGPVNPQMFGPPCQGMVASVPRPPPVGSSSGLIAKNSSVPEIRVGPTDPVSSLDVAPSASADQKES